MLHRDHVRVRLLSHEAEALTCDVAVDADHAEQLLARARRASPVQFERQAIGDRQLQAR